MSYFQLASEKKKSKWKWIRNFPTTVFIQTVQKIRQSTIYYAGLLGRWDKQIVDQASDGSLSVENSL